MKIFFREEIERGEERALIPIFFHVYFKVNKSGIERGEMTISTLWKSSYNIWMKIIAFSSFHVFMLVVLYSRGKAKKQMYRWREEIRSDFSTHLGMNRILSAKTKPTITSRFDAGNTNGNTNSMNPKTIGTWCLS